ncbi:aconitate hydratase [Clostridium estertheticum]|uniref:Aconitate hydratase n=1 Tax=Clostridium estertheticum subsp. estertheticum TaxID=1552 RepID=A0A1J0GBR4_9CLOT|nr:aconitate hydratase [Clostridium estertheticum]APC38723.1 aconitate hydratase [Clostridium estertheticum subsp. estertheticum]MBU3074668.1 aconitate hydratase [Clostridium estertheticum]MBU3164620.1 aconitate hydratase [Clostridium estertheticum]MBZ9615422.1 aconitate hydratase [Clostridium estertheticum subsp. laramiense]MCB2341932.1 aconitate hydratase [Clostridium estertheticum]
MEYTVAQKIIKAHLVKGEMITDTEIAIKIDQTLTQDSTGTMAYLQFEAMGIDKVQTKKSVAYIDHNILQTGPENADDHLYIQTVAKKHGIYFSKPGNGICHQVHLERFGVPGETLLGSDSHTPTGGGIGMLAIGAGGLDVAVAMGGGEYYITMPKIVKVNLSGKLSPWVAAKDIILEVLRRLTVKGGVNKIFEYAGDGLKTLSVPDRATITNMGAELGATTSIFPSDDITYKFLKAQHREEDFVELKADDGAVYDETVEIDLSKIEPLVACPHSPDKVVLVSSLKDIKVDQVLIGSCTNSSYVDMMKVSKILLGKNIPEDMSLAIAPGSKQVLNMLSKNGGLGDMIDAGARILESACGPCIGMGQAPSTGAVSLRTFNRNFKGRSGTTSANVYIVSPEVAVASALKGYITDPRELGEAVKVDMPEEFVINDNLIISPAEDGKDIIVKRGPNIKPFPKAKELIGNVTGKILTKLGDNITTDDIMPSNAKLLPFRSNIPYLAEFCLTPSDAEFPAKAKKYDGGIIVAGSNYGQGSSREHAALAPLYLGVKVVLTKSFARIHKANLINNAIIPLVFNDVKDYEDIDMMDELVIEDAANQIKKGLVIVKNITKGSEYKTLPEVTQREKEMLIHGGLINLMKNKKKVGV